MYSRNPLEMWEKVLEILSRQLSKPSFETWLKNTRAVSCEGNIFTVEVPNDFARDWLENRYQNHIKEALFNITNHPLELAFSLPRKGMDWSRNPFEDIAPSYLNPKYTFDTFVVGNSNRFAHAASLAVSEAPAKAYNPLFIYGGVGLGKTHLMQAIGHFLLSHNPQTKVVYVSSETFTNELINSIRDDKTLDFRNKYRGVDILLVDDIQFLAGKERTQEEFFHTFNALHEANRQIVISSDRPPKEIPTLEDRLRSRFEWGLITDIQPPDLETRIAILRKKAKIEKLLVPDEVMLLIANKIQSNIRELEGALNRVMAFSTMTNSPISLDLANEALKDIIPAAKPKQISIALVQQVVGDYYHLKIEDFKAKKRTRSVSFPRQIAMYICRELTDYSLPKIGEEFGGRDHTTVIHAHEKITSNLENSEPLRIVIKELTERIRNS